MATEVVPRGRLLQLRLRGLGAQRPLRRRPAARGSERVSARRHKRDAMATSTSCEPHELHQRHSAVITAEQRQRDYRATTTGQLQLEEVDNRHTYRSKGTELLNGVRHPFCLADVSTRDDDDMMLSCCKLYSYRVYLRVLIVHQSRCPSKLPLMPVRLAPGQSRDCLIGCLRTGMRACSAR